MGFWTDSYGRTHDRVNVNEPMPDDERDGCPTVWVVMHDCGHHGDDWTVDGVFPTRQAAVDALGDPQHGVYVVSEWPVHNHPPA